MTARPKADKVVYAVRQASAALHRAYTRLYDPGLYSTLRPGNRKHIDHAFALTVEAAIKLAPHVEHFTPIPRPGRGQEILDLMADIKAITELTS